VEPEPGSLAEYFDGWYADITGSPVKDEIQQRYLGLPPHLLSTSLLGWDGIAEAAAGLRLFPGGTLVDLACGRDGYGLEIAARTGARLIGVDFSAEAVRQAREQARRLGATAAFGIGDLAATGLDAGSADAVLCVDAIQFAPQPDAAYCEIRRILTPGGRAWPPAFSVNGGLGPCRSRRGCELGFCGFVLAAGVVVAHLMGAGGRVRGAGEMTGSTAKSALVLGDYAVTTPV
jgi:SAM-dependent methyltransferase